MLTEDGINVKTGALIWYVNKYGHIHPIIFKTKGKSTVKYFSLYDNAMEEARKVRIDNELKYQKYLLKTKQRG